MKILVVALFFLASFVAFSQDSTKTFGYNYRKGMLHYNKGVDMINWMGMDSGHSPIYLDSVRTDAKEEFNMALPYLQKAYLIKPKEENILKALQGVYFTLEDQARSDRYRNELEAVKK